MSFRAGEWTRHASSTFSFAATLAEVQDWVREALPEELGPFMWVGEEQVRAPGAPSAVERLYRFPLEELVTCATTRAPGALFDRSIIFLGSAQLTPELLEEREGDVDRWLAVNGLPFVDVSGHGPARRPTRLALNTKIRPWWEPGPVVEHRDYTRLYRRLQRFIRARLALAQVRELEGGDPAREPYEMLLSAGLAAALRERGFAQVDFKEPPAAARRKR